MGSTINSCRSALLGPNPLRHQRRFQRRRRSCDVYAVFIPVRFPWQESKFPNYLLVQIVKFRLNVLLLLPLIRFSTLVAVAMDADHKQPAHHFITTHQGSLVWGGGRLAAPSDHWRRRRHTHTHSQPVASPVTRRSCARYVPRRLCPFSQSERTIATLFPPTAAITNATPPTTDGPIVPPL